MTIRETAIYQLKKLKGQPLKKKLSYIGTYYGVPIAAVLAAIVIVISMIVHYHNIKPSALNVCCVNTMAEQESIESYLHGFAREQQIDLEEYEVTARTGIGFSGINMEMDYRSSQLLLSMIVSGEIDVMAADRDTILTHCYQQACVDLTGVLTQEQMEALAPHLLYMDLEYVEKMASFTEDPTQYPDPSKPEDMAQPIPIAIAFQPEWEFAQIAYPHTYADSAIALITTGENRGSAEAFLQYILAQEEK